MKTQLTVDDTIDKFLLHIYEEGDNSIIPAHYEEVLQHFSGYVWGLDTHVNKVTTEDIAMYFNFLLGHQGGYLRKYRPILKPGQYEQVAIILRKFWHWVAYVYQIPSPFIPDNLAEFSNRIQPVDVDILKQLLKLLDNKVQSNNDLANPAVQENLRDIALLLILFDAGPRAEELTWLKIEDVDLKSNTIVVYDVQKKSRKVPISSKLTPRLNAYIQSRFPERAKGDTLFFTKDDKRSPIDREAVHEILVKLGYMVNLNNINALQFRSAFAKNYHDGNMLDDHLIGLMGLRTNQQLRLYVDRHGNKKLKKLWEEHFKPFQSND